MYCRGIVKGSSKGKARDVATGNDKGVEVLLFIPVFVRVDIAMCKCKGKERDIAVGKGEGEGRGIATGNGKIECSGIAMGKHKDEGTALQLLFFRDA